MDSVYMELAINLAKLGVGHVNPNPVVGAVIVKDNKLIGAGYHEKFGGAHAEVNAINSVCKDIDIGGSTLYVTLEPCSHYGKTPPCVDLIIKMGFQKVVIGMLDPNPLVCGKSVQKMKDNGIEVVVGVKEVACKKMNEVFLKYISKNLPFVLLKSGMSLDGKISTNTGESKWITSHKSRKDGHTLRNKYSAIMVGVNTIITDNPRLTCRLEKEDCRLQYEIVNESLEKYNFRIKTPDFKIRNPIRIVLDSNLRVPLDSYVIQDKSVKTIIATTENADKNKKHILEKMKIEIIETKSKNNKVNLIDLIKKIGEMGIDSILIEGGGTVNFSSLREGIVDKVRFYIAPKIIGGTRSRGCISGEGFDNLNEIINLEKMSIESFDEDIIIEGCIKK